MNKKTARRMIGVLAVLVLSLPAAVTQADVAIQELSGVFDEFLIGGDLSVFYRYDHQPYFTKETVEGNHKVTRDNTWGEIFARLNFTAKKKFEWAEMEAKFSPIFMSTFDKDVYGLAQNTAEVDFNQAYIAFSGLFDGPFSTTIGMQDIMIEKQFLVGLGRTQETAYWLLFNQSFPFAARIDGDFGAFSTTAFVARPGRYVVHTFEGDKDLYLTGINLHYDIAETAYVYGGFFAKIDDTEPGTIGFLQEAYQLFFQQDHILAQTDTYALDIGGDLTFGGLNLEAEFVYQLGGVKFEGVEYDRKAFGFFAAAQYQFPVSLSPYAKFHFIYWPGDDDFTDGDIKEYDPMFWGWWAWNRWLIGEHIGELFGLVTNTRKYIAEIGFFPFEPCQVQLLYIKHQLDQKYFPYGVLAFDPIASEPLIPVSSNNFADEFNLFVNWQVNDFLFVHSGVGLAIPNQAAKEVAGDNKTAFFGQLWLMFAF